jgi:hypothetical protein
MPRQPLVPSLHKGPWGIGPRLVESRPEHVALIGRCITLWPDVLHQMGMLLGILLGVNSEAAVAVFSTFRNARVRQDAMIAAANYTLDEQTLELLNAILVVVGSAEKERDHLAHGCYGSSDNIADGILWIESKHLGPWNVSMLLKEPHRTGGEHAEIAAHIFVYRKADIQEIYDGIHDAWRAMFEFLVLVRWHPGLARSRDEQYHLVDRI